MNQQQAEHTPIADVMQQHTHCATEHQSVAELAALFLDKGISAAPVADANGKPIGFVSKTDIVRELKGQRPAARPEIGTHVQPWWDPERLSRLLVGEIMTPTLYTFSPSTSIADATAAMAFEGIHHLPVVEEESGKLVGMLSALDVLDWMARKAGYTPADGKHGRIFERST
jgi:CBS domain-containing protein